MKKIVNLLGTGESNEVVNYYSFSSRRKTDKQTNKQRSPLTLTISCEKRSCLIQS